MTTEFLRRLRSRSNPDVQIVSIVSLDENNDVSLTIDVNGHTNVGKTGKGLRGLMFAVVTGVIPFETELLSVYPDLEDSDGELVSDTLYCIKP
jgi:hypothetical protein